MTTQITVRLPEDLVEFLDREIRAGTFRSRAAGVAKGLERVRRETQAARDLEILRQTPYDEFDDFNKWAAAHAIEPDDA